MPVYATPAELAAWTGTEAPDNATQLLRSASLLVADAVRVDVYPADPDTLLPTATAQATALRDATCAQAAAWAALGLDPAAGAAGAVSALAVASSGIGGANVQYATSVTGDDVRRAATGELVGEAVLVLRAAGFLTGAPYVARY